LGLQGGKLTFKILRLNEPELYFSNNKTSIDPQVGLLNFGPNGGVNTGKEKEQRFTITAGIIGTTRSINSTNIFLGILNHHISAEETSSVEYKGIDFPGLGLQGPLRFEIVIDSNCVLKIEREFIRNLSKLVDRKERVKQLVGEYCRQFDLLTDAYPKPNVVLLPLDDELIELCKDPELKTDKIIFQRRDFGDPESANASMFDFHNHIKAQAASPKRDFVTQMINPKTLAFSEDKQSAALIAWNFSVGVFYKATGVPWKLADINENTCYIGISFYREIVQENMTMRASIAQVYMRTGESQVITGRPFRWDQRTQGKNVKLDSAQMSQIVADSVKIFEDQRHKLPERLVVHKSSAFNENEINGCLDGAKCIDEIDIVNVSEYTDFRAYHNKYDYPVVRGTLITQKEKTNQAFLFTSGFVPALGTYPGSSVPKPLLLNCNRIDTSIELIGTDILGLSKLDWNSATFYTTLPVTLSVSEKVGNILAEMVLSNIPPPPSYRYYM
jgi:hypothetical protein